VPAVEARVSTPRKPSSKRTKTSTFGVGGRRSHNAAEFYAQRLAVVEESTDETVAVAPIVDRLWCKSSETMSELPDNSVALVVTSPPYHVGKDYDTSLPVAEFLALLERVFTETMRVLEPGGRAAVNVANLGRKPYFRYTDAIASILLDIGFHARGDVVWRKGTGSSGSFAWGSYLRPSNPVLRDVHENIVIVSKGRFDRALHWRDRQERGLPWEATITKEDFMTSTLSVWDIQPESAKRVGHPAPFPVELPRRLIELYTWRGDLVLDPFVGAGATAVAAASCDRRYAGYDLDATYLAKAQARIDVAIDKRNQQEAV
jgi:site-specific DNA-methyltransferase (adenine-specific)